MRPTTAPKGSKWDGEQDDPMLGGMPPRRPPAHPPRPRIRTTTLLLHDGETSYIGQDGIEVIVVPTRRPA